jgi:hypothetical protein
MENRNYKEYYNESLQKSLEYQDFIQEQILKHLNFNISYYCSKKYQKEKGESLNGIEIKYQDMLSKINNIYIEYAEKPSPDKKEYWPSGIDSEDKSWLWITGDYKTIYIIPKNYLKMLKNSKFAKHKTTATSKGYTLTREEAERYAANVIKLD